MHFSIKYRCKKQNKIYLQTIIPTKISISLTEKGLFIPHFSGGKITIFGNVTKNGYVAKNDP